jgi:hypothetical protein
LIDYQNNESSLKNKLILLEKNIWCYRNLFNIFAMFLEIYEERGERSGSMNLWQPTLSPLCEIGKPVLNPVPSWEK